MPAGASKTQPPRTSEPTAVATNPSPTNWLAPLLGLAIILLTFAAYYPSLHNGFIWDDDDLLMENPLVMGPLRDIWFTTKFWDYYPLTLTSLWAEWRVFGMKAGPYHFDNILLHALSALVFWRVFLRLKVPGAWLAATVFAVHPVTVESAAWIAERKNTTPMVFYALTLLFFLRSLPTDSTIPAHNGYNRWYWFAVVAFLFALLAKTSVVMLPFVLLGCIWWQTGKISRQDFVRTIPFFLLSFILGLVTVWVQYNRAISTDVVQTAGFAEKLARAGWAVWFYLAKVLVPWPLYLGYPRWHVDSHNVLSYAPGFALVLWTAVFWRFRESWGRPMLFATGYFIVTLFPVLGFFNIYFQKYSYVADHWQYISVISIIALVVGAAVHYLSKLPQRKVALTVFGVAIITSCSAITWNLCLTYKNEETLWRHTLVHNPSSWLAHHNLGADLAMQSGFLANRNAMPEAQAKLKEAMQEFRETIKIKPDHAQAHFNLAQSLMKFDQWEEAIEEFRQAVRHDPDMVGALVTLAWHYATTKGPGRDGAEAVRLALRAVDVTKRKSADALDALAAGYAESEKFDEAQKIASEALEVAREEKDDHLATEIEARLRNYRLYRPFRE